MATTPSMLDSYSLQRIQSAASSSSSPAVEPAPFEPMALGDGENSRSNQLSSSSTLESFATAINTAIDEPPAARTTVPRSVLDEDEDEDEEAYEDARAGSTPGLANAVDVPAPPARPAPTRTNTNRNRGHGLVRLLGFFGYGPYGRNNKARRELVSLIWTLSIDIAEVRLCDSHCLVGRR